MADCSGIAALHRQRSPPHSRTHCTCRTSWHKEDYNKNILKWEGKWPSAAKCAQKGG